MAQAQKSANAAFFERVEKLKLAQDWTWDEIAQKLHLTRGMIHFIKQGKYGVSKRNLFRLEQLERQESIGVPGARELIESVVSNIEGANLKITPADFDRGYVEVPVKYARGEPSKGFPKKIRLRRPDVKAAAKLVVGLLADEDYSVVLLACIHPREFASHEFLNLLTPFSFQALMDAAMELTFGAQWREQFKQPPTKH